MAEHRILLFYVFTPLADPEAVKLWQLELCERLHLRGRVIVAPQGINATVGGELDDVKAYARALKAYAPFRAVDLKWSAGNGDDFPRLSVKVRPELVAFDARGEVAVDASGVVGGGAHLSPQGLHDLVSARGDEVVFFDGRNAFEASVGRFKGAVIPNVKTTHDFIPELDSGRFDWMKDRPVVTYCTGGVRCEVLSALMVRRGWTEVYQLDGGIHRYGETYGDRGLWEGSLVVFDERMVTRFSDEALVLGTCEACTAPTDRYVNCDEPSCRALVLQCTACATTIGAAPCAADHVGRR